MSLSPVTGTEVPETANGVVTPVLSENGTVSVKCGGSRVPCSGDLSQDGTLMDTGNYVDVENRVCDGEGRLEMYSNGKASGLPSHTSHVTDASLSASTLTEGSKDSDVPEDLNTAEPPDAAPPGDSTHSKDFTQGQATTYGQQMEAVAVDGDTNSREEEEEEEEDDGEKEKQDEEEDEKNEKKWIHQRSGGRAEVKVSGLNYFKLY